MQSKSTTKGERRSRAGGISGSAILRRGSMTTRQVKIIALARFSARQLVFVEPGIESNCPLVGETVTVKGEPWRVASTELRDVLGRFPDGERVEGEEGL